LSDQTKENKQSGSSGITYEPCVVSFIDVLGFRSVINTRSAAEVHSILTSLENFTRPEDEPLARSMDEVRRHSRAFAFSVSDAIVRVRPYNTQYRDGAFFWELNDLLHAQVALIANNVLIRAGVTVGDAYVGYNGEGPVFGPAMVRAFEIESQEAIYPRIVIDDYAIEQHQTNPWLRSQDNTLEYEIKAVADLLTTGEDGTRFIDYLRASYSQFEGLASYLDFLSSHADLVRDGQKQATDRRTRRKYEWLARYHDRSVARLLEQVAASSAMRDELYEEGVEVDAAAYVKSLFVLESEG
jgi:hypothetical protein